MIRIAKPSTNNLQLHIHVWHPEWAWAEYAGAPLGWSKPEIYQEDIELRKVLKDNAVLRDEGLPFNHLAVKKAHVAVETALKAGYPVWITVDYRAGNASVCDELAAKYGCQAVQFALEGPLPKGHDWENYEDIGAELRIEPKGSEGRRGAAIGMKPMHANEQKERLVEQTGQRKIIGWKTTYENGREIATPIYED